MVKSTVCFETPRKKGEKAIELMRKLGLFDKSLEIVHKDEWLCIPLVKQPNEEELTALKGTIPESRLSTGIFPRKQAAATVIKALEDKLPQQLLEKLPQALDVIGDIAVIAFPLELQPYQNIVGQAILKTHKNIKTVLAKAGAISGTYRLRDFIFVAGENKTQTVHREYGCQYHVDVTKAYFSPRLSTEHMRVASLVQQNETVVDLFAGVGPFSVLIAKKNLNVQVFAVDINPEAVEWLKVNVMVNKVENRVIPILGDARQVSATMLKGVADRVIMNLPETAIEFVDAACQAIRPQGGIIHFYGFVRKPDSIEKQKLRFVEAVEKNNRKVIDFLYSKSIRETAPFESQVALDAKVL